MREVELEAVATTLPSFCRLSDSNCGRCHPEAVKPQKEAGISPTRKTHYYKAAVEGGALPGRAQERA